MVDQYHTRSYNFHFFDDVWQAWIHPKVVFSETLSVFKVNKKLDKVAKLSQVSYEMSSTFVTVRPVQEPSIFNQVLVILTCLF